MFTSKQLKFSGAADTAPVGLDSRFRGGRLSGGCARRLGARPFPRQQFPPDHVQVVALVSLDEWENG